MNDIDIPILKKSYDLYKTLNEYRDMIPNSTDLPYMREAKKQCSTSWKNSMKRDMQKEWKRQVFWMGQA